MSKMIFVTVPVHDLAASTALYLALGGEVNARLSDGQATSIMFSDAIGVMLMTPERYREVVRRPAGDAEPGRHALLTLRAGDSDGDVWEIAWMEAAAQAGARATA